MTSNQVLPLAGALSHQHLYITAFLQPPWIEECGITVLNEQGNWAACTGDKLPGLDVHMFFFIKDLLGFNYSIEFQGTIGGPKDPENYDGEWHGMIGELQSGRANMSINTPYLTTGKVGVDVLLKPFQYNFWIFVLVMIPITSILVRVVSEINKRVKCAVGFKQKALSMSDIIFEEMSAFVQQGHIIRTGSVHEFISFSWLFAMAIAGAMYTTLVYGSIVLQGQSAPPFSSVETMAPVVASGEYKIFIANGILAFLKTRLAAKSPALQALARAIEINEPIVYVDAQRFNATKMMREYETEHNQKLVYLDIDFTISMMNDLCGLELIELPDLDGNFYAPGFHKGYPDIDKFNDFSQLIYSQYQYLEDYYRANLPRAACDGSLDTNVSKLSLRHLWPILAVCALGNGLGFLALLQEIFHNQLVRMWNKATKTK